MLNVYSVSCVIEKPHEFTDGKGVVIYQAILIVYAGAEERVRQLISIWATEGIKIDVKKIQKDGVTHEAETIMKAWDKIIETRPIEN